MMYCDDLLLMDRDILSAVRKEESKEERLAPVWDRSHSIMQWVPIGRIMKFGNFPIIY